jgi:hypothetical protein
MSEAEGAATEATAAPETPVSGADSGTQASGDSGPSGSVGYLEKARQDPDWAISELRKHQGRADRAESENRELLKDLGGSDGEVLQWVKAAGHQTVAKAIGTYAALRQNEHLGPVFAQYETTGELPSRAPGNSGGDAVEEEYLTQEEKRINALEAKNQALEGRLNALTQSSGTAALQGHLEKVAQDYHLTPEEFAKVKTGLSSQVKQWGVTEPGRQLLQQLQDPDSYDSVEAVALKYIPKQALRELGRREELREQQRLQGFETDGPSKSATTGTEPPPEIKTAQDAIKFARSNPDKLRNLGY